MILRCALLLLCLHQAAAALTFPVSGVAMQEGDILLAYSPTALSAAIARYAEPQGDYSHTALFHVSPLDGPRIVEMGSRGLESVDPAKFFKQFHRMALVRLARKFDEAALSQSVEQLFAEARAGRVAFDFKMAWSTDADGHYLCNEMVTIAYLRAGLPDPFPAASRRDDSIWAGWVKQNTSFSLNRIVSPNALLQQPGFKVLAEIERDGNWPGREVVLDAALDRMRLYIEKQGLEPAGPGPGSRLLISIGRSGLFEDKLAVLLSRLDVNIYYFMTEYMERIDSRVRQIRRRSAGEVWSDERLRELTYAVCDAYRERFFRKR